MPDDNKPTAAEKRAAERRKRQTEALRANLQRRKTVTETETPPELPPDTE
jgi:hypothetical protein